MFSSAHCISSIRKMTVSLIVLLSGFILDEHCVFQSNGTDHVRRNSLDYIGRHDYDDIDGASTATKAMLLALKKSTHWHNRASLMPRSPCASIRGSLTSFKSNGDILFQLPSSATQTSRSIQTSSETLNTQPSPHIPYMSRGTPTIEGRRRKSPLSPGFGVVNSFKGSAISTPKNPQFKHRQSEVTGNELFPESPQCCEHPTDDEDRMYWQADYRRCTTDCPRRFRESPYGKMMVTPSPVCRELQASSSRTGSVNNGDHVNASTLSDDLTHVISCQSNFTCMEMFHKPSMSSGEIIFADGEWEIQNVPENSAKAGRLANKPYRRPVSPLSSLPSGRMSHDSTHRDQSVGDLHRYKEMCRSLSLNKRRPSKEKW